MKSIIVLITLAITLLLIGTPKASADVAKCTPVFNGGPSCTQPDNIELDKFIQNPTNKTFLDNLNPTTQHVNPDQALTFRLSIKNKDTQKLNNIKITDTLPQSLEYVNASNNGKYDESTHTVTYEIDLTGNASQNLTLTTRAKANTDTDTTCVANQATAEIQGKKAADNSQFCIARQPAFPSVTPQPAVLSQPTVGSTTSSLQPGSTTKGGKTLYPTPANVTTNPNTGPEALALVALIPTAVAGLILRRKYN